MDADYEAWFDLACRSGRLSRGDEAAARAGWDAATGRAAGKVERAAAGVRAINATLDKAERRTTAAAALDAVAKSIRDGGE
jgi:hypothetical protein